MFQHFLLNVYKHCAGQVTHTHTHRRELPQLLGIYEKPLANNILNNETECFLSKIRTRQGCQLLQSLFNILLQVLTNVTRQEK